MIKIIKINIFNTFNTFNILNVFRIISVFFIFCFCILYAFHLESANGSTKEDVMINADSASGSNVVSEGVQENDSDNDWDMDPILHHEVLIEDPFENFNRKVFKFNKDFDDVLLKPLANKYRDLVPNPIGRKRISSFFDNLLEPIFAINSILQFKMDALATSFMRFFLNTTFGGFGFRDIASEKYNIHQKKISFGDTLAFYGLKPGPYIMIPFLGPSTVRNGIGLGVDFFSDPIYLALNKHHKDGVIIARLGLGLIVLRSDLMDAFEDVENISLDEYAMIRTLYMQYINKKQQDHDYSIFSRNNILKS